MNNSINKTQRILNGKLVLLADDMDFNRFAYRILLERMGAIVVEAIHGVEALEKLQSENFDMVILDNNMPFMSGIEVAQQYFSTATATANPPLFIAYSALTDSGTTEKCLSAGFCFFVEKPLTADKLKTLLNSKKYKSSLPQGGLLDYLGGDDATKVAQLALRYRRSYEQELAELIQVIKLKDQGATRSCVHKLRGFACLQNNPNVMETLDMIAGLIAANAVPNEYTHLLDQLKSYVTDDGISG